jgi:hypothetical protein
VNRLPSSLHTECFIQGHIQHLSDSGMEMSRAISSVSLQVTNEALLSMYSKAEIEVKWEKMRKREHLISCIQLCLLGVWLDGGGSRETATAAGGKKEGMERSRDAVMA